MGYYGRGDGNCYGKGDYYRGDYYRGDFLGIGRAVSRAAGAVARVAGGVARVATSVGLGGPLVAAIGRATTPGVALAVRPSGAPVSLEQYGAGGLMIPSGPAFSAAGGGGPYGMTVMGTPGGVAVCKTQGYHVNKAGYFRRTPGGQVAYIEKGSACVRNRRMNPANGRALTRALRRAVAFKKLAMKAIRVIDAGKRPKKFAGFKTGRKRA